MSAACATSRATPTWTISSRSRFGVAAPPPAAVPRPDSLSVEDFHWKLRFSNDGRMPGQQVRFLDCPARIGSRLAFLPPAPPPRSGPSSAPERLAGVNVQTQAAFAVPVAGEPTTTPTLLRVRYDGQRFSPSLPAVPPGPIVIEVENTGTARGSLLLINWPPEIVALTSQAGARLRAIHVRRNVACETDLPAPVPVGARRRERKGSASGR